MEWDECNQSRTWTGHDHPFGLWPHGHCRTGEMATSCTSGRILLALKTHSLHKIESHHSWYCWEFGHRYYICPLFFYWSNMKVFTIISKFILVSLKFLAWILGQIPVLLGSKAELYKRLNMGFNRTIRVMHVLTSLLLFPPFIDNLLFQII